MRTVGSSLIAKYDLWSNYSVADSGTKQTAFLGGRVLFKQKNESVPEAKSSPFADSDLGDEQYHWVGENMAGDPVSTEALVDGLGSGTDLQFELTGIGGAQVRIHDLTIGAQ